MSVALFVDCDCNQLTRIGAAASPFPGHAETRIAELESSMDAARTAGKSDEVERLASLLEEAEEALEDALGDAMEFEDADDGAEVDVGEYFSDMEGEEGEEGGSDGEDQEMEEEEEDGDEEEEQAGAAATAGKGVLFSVVTLHSGVEPAPHLAHVFPVLSCECLASGLLCQGVRARSSMTVEHLA